MILFYETDHQNDFRQIASMAVMSVLKKDPEFHSKKIARALCLGTGDKGLRFRKLFSNNMIEVPRRISGL